LLNLALESIKTPRKEGFLGNKWATNGQQMGNELSGGCADWGLWSDQASNFSGKSRFFYAPSPKSSHDGSTKPSSPERLGSISMILNNFPLGSKKVIVPPLAFAAHRA
jgi:hypothetical protein